LWHKIRRYPAAEYCPGVISDGNDDDGSTEFDDSMKPGPKPILGLLTQTQFYNVKRL